MTDTREFPVDIRLQNRQGDRELASSAQGANVQGAMKPTWRGWDGTTEFPIIRCRLQTARLRRTDRRAGIHVCVNWRELGAETCQRFRPCLGNGMNCAGPMEPGRRADNFCATFGAGRANGVVLNDGTSLARKAQGERTMITRIEASNVFCFRRSNGRAGRWHDHPGRKR